MCPMNVKLLLTVQNESSTQKHQLNPNFKRITVQRLNDLNKKQMDVDE